MCQSGGGRGQRLGYGVRVKYTFSTVLSKLLAGPRSVLPSSDGTSDRRLHETTHRTDDIYDMFPLRDLDLSGQIHA